jgi:3-oxoacyl-ACP reductase-like protein
MGILSNIFHKIFPSSHPAVTQAATQAATPAATTTAAAPATPAASVASATTKDASVAEVDVESILNNMSGASSLNWRTSIVDLLKLLGLDSSLESRKELAKELNYTGDTGDSATMNIWLHRQVMNKLAANGGKVPADLKD